LLDCARLRFGQAEIGAAVSGLSQMNPVIPSGADCGFPEPASTASAVIFRGKTEPFRK
jgi:hypothetical protein